MVAQTTVKSRPEDPWEKEMVTHFSILASCLENPMDGGAQQATVHGAAVRHIPYLVLSIFVHSSLQKKTLFCPTPDQVKFYLISHVASKLISAKIMTPTSAFFALFLLFFWLSAA